MVLYECIIVYMFILQYYIYYILLHIISAIAGAGSDCDGREAPVGPLAPGGRRRGSAPMEDRRGGQKQAPAVRGVRGAE